MRLSSPPLSVNAKLFLQIPQVLAGLVTIAVLGMTFGLQLVHSSAARSCGGVKTSR